MVEKTNSAPCWCQKCQNFVCATVPSAVKRFWDWSKHFTMGVVLVGGCLWLLHSQFDLTGYANLLDLQRVRLLSVGVLMMTMFGTIGGLFADKYISRSPTDQTGIQKLISVLGMTALCAAIAGLFICAFKAGSKTQEMKDGFDSLLIICGILAGKGLILLTGAKFWESSKKTSKTKETLEKSESSDTSEAAATATAIA